ncbi:MAG: pilus assembly protein PilM, partial [Dehalococcoidales bacterium]|nr:pilus assembly protein PilM [Dehalococcoidales bacterium]
MARDTMSLYFGDSGIRVMTTRGRRITKLAYIPVDINLADSKASEKENEIANQIRHLFRAQRIGGRRIILGISGLHCFVRPVLLPELPRKMLEEAVSREAKRVFPVPLDQFYLSWQIMSSSGGKARILLVAIPRNIADAAVR